MKTRTVFVGLSGGVDSSVTAALLKERGFKVVGVHLKCWNVDGCAAQDAEDARRAAETLDIPFYVFDFEKEYRDRVVEYMVAGYKKGITPNPDVACNQEIKFGLFYRRAMTLGADFVATGHYVKRVGDKLYAAKDEDKDQSYFLWTLKKEQIKHCLFPLGDLIKKTQVRQLAKKYKLPNAEKKDSQGICFIGQVSLPEFLSEFIPNRKGAIVNVAGEKLGEHQGAYYYTIGQRKGLGIGGSPVPLYVSRKDVKKNTITVAPEEDKSLYQSKVTLTEMSFTGTKPAGVVWARIRYRQPLFKATMVAVRNVGVVRDVGNGQAKRSNKRSDRTNRTYRLIFSKPQKFVAPGQSAVLYRVARSTGSGSKSKDFEMLGGGVIR